MKESKYYKPQDFDECWSRWKEETLAIDSNVVVDHIDPQDFGSLIYFYFNSLNNTKIHCRFYVNDDGVKNNRPVVILYHGAGSCTWDDHNIYHCLNWAKNGFLQLFYLMRSKELCLLY